MAAADLARNKTNLT